MNAKDFNTIKSITGFDFPCISQFNLDLIYETNDIEFLCKVLEKLNEVIDSQKLIVEDFNKIVEFCNEKIEEYTKETLEKWLNDGTLDDILRDLLFQKTNRIKLFNISTTRENILRTQSLSIVTTPSGKNIMIDTGHSNSWNGIKPQLDNYNLNKIDMLLITHYHYDHVTNLENLINNYDMSNCTVLLPILPRDGSTGIVNFNEIESNYNEVIRLLESNNINYIFNTNRTFTYDRINIKILNSEESDFSFYYNENNTGLYNNFSNVYIFEFGNSIISFFGDIQSSAQEHLYPFLEKPILFTVPHHGNGNKFASKNFIEKIYGNNYAINTIPNDTKLLTIDLLLQDKYNCISFNIPYKNNSYNYNGLLFEIDSICNVYQMCQNSITIVSNQRSNIYSTPSFISSNVFKVSRTETEYSEINNINGNAQVDIDFLTNLKHGDIYETFVNSDATKFYEALTYFFGDIGFLAFNNQYSRVTIKRFTDYYNLIINGNHLSCDILIYRDGEENKYRYYQLTIRYNDNWSNVSKLLQKNPINIKIDYKDSSNRFFSCGWGVGTNEITVKGFRDDHIANFTLKNDGSSLAINNVD